MCGIGGISYDSTQHPGIVVGDAVDLLKALKPRGPHAHGIAFGTNGKVVVYKALGTIESKTAQERLNRFVRKHTEAKGIDWLFVHTRFATHGDQKYMANNHPVRHRNVIGVHNGVIDNYEAVLETLGGREDKKAGVDSEAIFAALHHKGLNTDAIQKVIGSVAFIAVNIEDPNTLLVGRGNSSPLIITDLIEDTKAVGKVWGSTTLAVAAVGGAVKLAESVLEGTLFRVTKGVVHDVEAFTPTERFHKVDWDAYQKPRYARAYRPAAETAISAWDYPTVLETVAKQKESLPLDEGDGGTRPLRTWEEVDAEIEAFLRGERPVEV